jgi:hypothetical protein
MKAQITTTQTLVSEISSAAHDIPTVISLTGISSELTDIQYVCSDLALGTLFLGLHKYTYMYYLIIENGQPHYFGSCGRVSLSADFALVYNVSYLSPQLLSYLYIIRVVVVVMRAAKLILGSSSSSRRLVLADMGFSDVLVLTAGAAMEVDLPKQNCSV